MKIFNKDKKLLKEITKDLVVSFFLASAVVFVTSLFFKDEFDIVFSLIDTVTVKVNDSKDVTIAFNFSNNRLESYPDYGKSFGTLKIPSVKIEKTLYHGDTMDILRYGLGHFAGSYFPGEGGTILIAGHNTSGFLRTLPKVNIGDEVSIETVYGDYTYIIYDTKVMKASELEKMDFKDEEETLVLYTCYPLTIGHPKTRYVVYARRLL